MRVMTAIRFVDGPLWDCQVQVPRDKPPRMMFVDGRADGRYERRRELVDGHPIPETHYRWVEADPLADYRPDWRERMARPPPRGL